MKKFSKLIALFSALCMLVTLFSGMTAFADGETAGESPAELAYYWDADNDFVSLDFEEAITQDSLSRIKLYLNGAEVPATVAFSLHASAGTEADIDEGRATRYTYLITPNNGAKISFDTIYTLKLTNVTGAASGKSVTDEVFFKVTKLSDITTYSSGSNAKTAWSKNKDRGSATIESVTNGISITQPQSGLLTLRHSLNKDNQNDSSLKDYTVKMTYSVGDSTKYSLYLAALYSTSGYDFGTASYKAAFLYLTNTVDSQTGLNVDSSKAVYLQENQYVDKQQHYHRTTTSAVNKWGDVKMEEDITLKLSTKGSFARGYVNGVKAVDMQLYTGDLLNYGGVAVGVNSSSAATAETPKTIVIKDFLATQAVEVNLTPEVITPLWDADSDFISLTFDKEMPLEALRGIVTLKKNGVAIPATVALNRHASTDAANSSLSTKLSTKYTYTVTPQEGMKLGDIYTLSLDGKFPADDGTKMYTFDFVKYFKVEKLDSGMQYASETNNAWNYASGNIANIDTMTYDSESDSLAIEFKPGTAWSNGMYYRHYPEYSTFDESLKDYTVKLTVTPGAGATATKYRLYAVGHGNANQNFGLRLDTMSDGTHVVNIQSALAFYAGGKTAFASDLYSDIVFGQPVELKLSTKGGVMNAYVNGTKVADYAMGTEAYGKAAFNIDVDCEGDAVPTATLSNYVMTKAVEITGFTVGNISVTKADGSAIGDSISGNVNVNVPVLNASNAEKDVYVVLAFYNGSKMTNCVVAPADTRIVSAGNFVTIPFTNIDPMGGNKLKVFVWNNTTSLIPYIDNIEFPAAS